MSPDLSRRSLLGAAATAGALAALPLSLRQAIAAPTRPGSLDDIEHVVVFMQENRAFDHYFGTMQGVRGFGDRTAVRGVTGRSVFHQPDPSRAEGYLLPFPMNAAHTNAYCSGAADFGFGTSMAAWNQGRADGWVSRRSNGWLAQGYYAADEMPFYRALASAFTICDAYYCSSPTSTNPNREHFMTGTSGGTVGDHAWLDNSEPGFGWTTYAERLQTAGISWKTYQAQENFDDNALAWFSTFRNAKAGDPLHDLGMTRVGNAADSGDPAKMGDALVAAFAADVAADALPQVSWIVAPAALSEHASYHPPAGEDLTARLVAALADNPEVFAKTAFLLTYDEHGGFFDHLLPPVPPHTADAGQTTVSTDGELVVQLRNTASGSTVWRVVDQQGRYRTVAVDGSFGWSETVPAGWTQVAGPFPVGLGVRVPMIVVSPWTRGGAVDSQVYDHTSILKFLEARFGVAEPNISAWRRAVSGDLTGAFDFSGSDATPPTGFPDTSGNVDEADADCGHTGVSVPTPQVFPRQAAGARPARALPYRLQVSGSATTGPAGGGSGTVDLHLRNAGTKAAVLAVHPAPGLAPRHHTLAPGTDLHDVWTVGPDGYDLRVHGPNGSLWALRGRDDAPDVEIEEDTRARKVVLTIRNTQPRTRTLLVGDTVYGDEATRPVRLGARDERRVTWHVGGDGWYDLAVTAEDDPWYLRRFTGRLADGRPGTTDPAMGAAADVALDLVVPPASSTIDETVLQPGRTSQVTTVVTNPGTAALTGLTAVLTAPAGWTAAAADSPSAASLAPGATWTVRWNVTPPAGATSCSGAAAPLLSAAVRARSADRLRLADAYAPVRLAPNLSGFLLAEDFESLGGALQTRVNLNVGADVLGWTRTAPAGWQVVNAAGMPQGTAEEQGWSFMTKRFWTASDSQDRANFTRGLGIVAVADPDDWDDTGSPSKKGTFDSTLVSPAVAVPSGADRLYLGFDSHYRQESPQQAEVTAEFDTGQTVTLLAYSGSATADNAGQDAENQFVARSFAVPSGASKVTLRFRLFNAGNNWYWAVDHIRLSATPVTEC